MSMWRTRQPFVKILVYLTALLTVAYIYYFFNDVNYAWYTWSSRNQKCKISDQEMTDLTELIKITHKILKNENITHFLVYGSLWGALRYGKPLPWDNDFDIGILYDDIQTVDMKTIKKKFVLQGVKIYYRPYLGLYRVSRKSARGDLMIFRDFGDGTMNRVGIESYLFFINYRHHHRFPSHLVHRPLPNLSFVGLQFPVPRHKSAIQMYHYRNDYWKEVKPKGCR